MFLFVIGKRKMLKTWKEKSEKNPTRKESMEIKKSWKQKEPKNFNK